ncbi:LamG-like jellyroll fold domain-containing protein [Geminisphaera colitermitum]|uniref:LamG-like jellyroll fold domain-containing protein n=1 Tax=Geminisphaera colitermitum TaxID=1148786 RepID=UPI000158C542|nr:LamG-like jellyroll fold domain-containing protein [Geminisphaera colitermitum]
MHPAPGQRKFPLFCLLCLAFAGLTAVATAATPDAFRPEGDNWRFTCRLADVGPKDSAWIELHDADQAPLYRLGFAAGRARVQQHKGGKWASLWTDTADSSSAGIGVFCFNGYLFLEVGEPGDVRHVVAASGAEVKPDIDPSTGKALRAAGPAGTKPPRLIRLAGNRKGNTTSFITDPVFEQGARPAVKRKPALRPMQKEAITCYLPWFPADLTALGYQRQNDFPAVPLRTDAGFDVLKDEIRLMAAHGLTAVNTDILFFTPERVRAGLTTFKRVLTLVREIRAEGFADFRMLPFIELKDIPLTVAGALYMLERFGDDPAWLRSHDTDDPRGRPVFQTYHHSVHVQLTPEKWTELVEGVAAGGRDSFWIYGFAGIKPALGNVAPEEARRIIPATDAVYHFGGSSLTASSGIARQVREKFSGLRPNLTVGGSVHVGYYSARTYSRNFISPRHTAELREQWAYLQSGAPDFVHLTTWNDWNEATTFCPSFSDLGSRLAIMQRYLAGWFGRPLPTGRDGVPEIVLSYRKSLYPGEPLRVEVLPLPTSNGAKKVRCEIVVTDAASGRVVMRETSPDFSTTSLDAMKAWYAQSAEPLASDLAPGVLRVAVRALTENGEIRYHHLPDIVVSETENYNDQLFYNVPLHRLAGPERSLALRINGSESASAKATGNGLYAVDYELSGPGSAGASVAGMKRGHLMRFLAPLDRDGAEVVDLNKRVTLTPSADATKQRRSVVESAARWTPAERGPDYFAVLARFEDGTWAYSPTVLVAPPVPSPALVADWVFAGLKPALMGNVAGLDKPKNVIEDRSLYRNELTLPEKNGLKFVDLPGSGGTARAMQFDGQTLLKAAEDTAGNGPLTVEVIFRPGQTGRHEVICWQRGAQAGLVMEKTGHLKLSRLPELRAYPDPFVEVRSRKPLAPDRFHHVVAVYDGVALTLWLNGERQESKPCLGTRSTEGFAIGGNSAGKVGAATVDGMPGEGFFTGQLVKLTVYGRGLPPQAISQLHQAAARLPFMNSPAQ